MIEVYFSKFKGVRDHPRRLTGAWNCWVRVTGSAGHSTEWLGSVEWVAIQKYSFNPTAHLLDSLLAKCLPAINKFIKDSDRRVRLRRELMRLEQLQTNHKRKLTTNHSLFPAHDVERASGHVVTYKGLQYAGDLMSRVEARKLSIQQIQRRIKVAKAESTMAMTEQQKLAYQKNPNECPFCKSTDLDARMFNADGKSAWRDIACGSCDREWRDVYTLTDVEEL